MHVTKESWTKQCMKIEYTLSNQNWELVMGPFWQLWMSLHYKGSSVTNFFMALFALFNEVHSLMFVGTKFHFFLASLLNVAWDKVNLAVSGTIFVTVALVSLSSSWVVFIFHLIGYSGTCVNFHASVNLIWAFIWLTDSMLSLLRIVFWFFFTFFTL